MVQSDFFVVKRVLLISLGHSRDPTAFQGPIKSAIARSMILQITIIMLVCQDK